MQIHDMLEADPLLRIPTTVSEHSTRNLVPLQWWMGQAGGPTHRVSLDLVDATTTRPYSQPVRLTPKANIAADSVTVNMTEPWIGLHA